MNKNMSWNDKNIEGIVIDQLNAGQIVAGTSDTIIGLLAPLTQKGFQALNEIKGRSDKPYLVLVGDLQQANQFTNSLQKEPLLTLAKKFWPGPLTLIVPAKKSVPSFAKSPQGAIAIRIPNHPQLQTIAKKMNGLFSTSANKANQPTPQTITDLDPEIEKCVGLIINDQQPMQSKPSTILDCTGKEIKIIREGAYTEDQLSKWI